MLAIQHGARPSTSAATEPSSSRPTRKSHSPWVQIPTSRSTRSPRSSRPSRPQAAEDGKVDLDEKMGTTSIWRTLTGSRSRCARI
jgi:hypothetical protein